VIDPLGRTGVRTEYDDRGRLVKLIDAAGKTVELIHDPDNSPRRSATRLGNPTTFEYDLRGNVITEVDALGGITRRTYDGNNYR
jgi:YD repeat-containing protein